MKLYIKNKIFSWGGGSKVVDENNNPVFIVKGKVFSPTRKKKICDLNGNVLFVVRNKWFNWFVHSAFVYDNKKNKIAKIKDKFFSVKGDFIVEGYQDEIMVDGKFLSFTSNIVRNGEVIGTIRRQITLIADAFELEANEEDMPFLIALIIAIDNIVDKKRSK